MRNERSKLDQLVRTHLPAGLRFATRLTGSTNEAEDLLQEALLRVVRNWTTYRETASFQTWFYRIVINAHRDRLRKKSADCSDESATWVDGKSSGPQQTAEDTETSELIAQKISTLPNRQREVMVLFVFEKMTVNEIATTLGIRNDNVHATLFAARQQLRVMLEPCLGRKIQ